MVAVMESPTMSPEEAKAIRRGIEVAEKKLAEIDSKISELKTLIEQRGHLQLYINQAKSLLGESAPTTGPSLASILGPLDSLRALTELRDELGRRLTSGNLGGTEGPLWRDATLAIAQAQRPLTVPEIVEAMKATGKPLTGENITEVVRVALNRKPEIVENVSRGRYALKMWPAEWKTRERPEDAPSVSALVQSALSAMGAAPLDIGDIFKNIKIPEITKVR